MRKMHDKMQKIIENHKKILRQSKEKHKKNTENQIEYYFLFICVSIVMKILNCKLNYDYV